MNKSEMLEKLHDECSVVFLDYFKGNEEYSKTVLGGGNPDAKIMFIGEAPGEQEITQGKPFVGSAGKNFEKFLENLDLTRNDVYVSNVVKIRPTRINPKTGRKNNRPPNSDEIELSRKFLDEEIKLVNPKLLVALGNVPLKRLTGLEGITNYHGKLVDSLYPQKVFCLFHPATLIYNHDVGFKESFYNDLNMLKELTKNI
jgi:DNA polymerase